MDIETINTIENRRRELGYSKAYTGFLIGCGGSHYKKIIRGKVNPRIDTIKKIYKVLKLYPEKQQEWPSVSAYDDFPEIPRLGIIGFELYKYKLIVWKAKYENYLRCIPYIDLEGLSIDDTAEALYEASDKKTIENQELDGLLDKYIIE